MFISDAARVQEQALTMVTTGQGQMDLNNAYFQRYANNHFITIVFYYFFKSLRLIGIQQVTIPLILLNTFCVDVGIYITYRMAKGMWGQPLANMTLLGFLLCPTTYLWLTTVYTNTMSFPFVMGILCLFLSLHKNTPGRKMVIKCILLGGIMAIGYHLRPTTILPILAVLFFVMVLLVQKNRNDKKEWMLKILVTGISFMVFFAGCCGVVNRHVDKTKLTGDFPITHWIMMGMNQSSYGAYASADEGFTMSFATKEEKTRATVTELKSRLTKMGPSGVAKQLFQKMIRVWAMGDDDSISKAGYASNFPIFYDAGVKRSMQQSCIGKYAQKIELESWLSVSIFVHIVHIIL